MIVTGRTGLAIVLLAASGCADAVERPQSVPIAQVPSPLRKVAEKTLPGIEFTSAYKIKAEGEDAYEIRGKDKRGKIREVEVSASGKVLEVE